MPTPRSIYHTFPNGRQIELFYVSALCELLGRTPTTIRKWEISGVIPETMFKDKTGKRLYTSEQIQAIVESAEEAHIKQGMPIANTSFSAKVERKMKVIKEEYISYMNK